jgi:hypothetical protein
MKQESLLRTFSEPLQEEELKNEKGFKSFIYNLDSSLNSKKRSERLKKFMTYPLECTSISDSILKELNKVFDSSNSFFNIEAETPELVERAWELVESMSLNKFIRNNAPDVMRSKANSIVLIDFDQDGGNPQINLIPIEDVLDFKLKNKEGELEYLILNLGTMMNEEGKPVNFYGVYDDTFYRVVSKVDGQEEPMIIIEEMHPLDECPARFFWSDSVSEVNSNYRLTPLWPVVGSLEKWERFNLFKFYADHYAPFPILERVKSSCPNPACKGGKVPEEYNTKLPDGTISSGTHWHTCKVCKDTDVFGPGSTAEIDPPKSKESFDPSGKIKFIAPEIEGLEYIDAKVLKENEKRIFHKVVGSGDLIQKEAVNEAQVFGSFESRQQVLIDLKTNLDKLYKWAAESVVKLYYGMTTNIEVTADYGTQFYLYTADDIYRQFDSAKKAGMSEGVLTNLWNQYIETKWKENPVEVLRLQMLKQIEPVPFKTYAEAQILRNDGAISNEDLVVKGNFTNLVARFEREQAPIVFFGQDLPMDTRIDRIKEIIYSYTKIENDGEGNV